jgi:hypothetical protein
MPFQPGQSGLPGAWNYRARPWKEALARALKRQQVLLVTPSGKLLPSLSHEDYDPATSTGNAKRIIPPEQALEVIADLTVQMALCGDREQINEIGNRLDGRPPQTVEGGEFPLVTHVQWLDGDDDDVVDAEAVEIHANGNGATTMLPPKPRPDEPAPTPEPTPDDDDDDDTAAPEGDEVLRVVDLDGDDVLGSDD